MNIDFVAMRMDKEIPEVVVKGDSLTINGVTYDFSPMGEGDVLPPNSVDEIFIAGKITRTGGQISLTLIVPHPAIPPGFSRALLAKYDPAVGDGAVTFPEVIYD